MKDVDTASQTSHKPTTRQLNAAVAVIEELSCEWDPAKHKDRYRERLRSVVQRKRKGETVSVPETDGGPEPAPDLMEALERTLAELTGGNGSSSSSKGNGRRGRSSSKRQRQGTK